MKFCIFETMLKKDLRKVYKDKRKDLTTSQIADLSIEIANKVLELPIWNYSYFHLFLSIESQKEIQTECILHILHAKDKEIIVPKSNFKEYSMTNFLLTDNTKILKNNYDIPEPVDGIEVPASKLDVVFVPLLAFDTKGNRVGYGKGFYDKMLEQCKPDCIKIGLSFFSAETEITDVFEGDIPLNYCVTPNQIYRF